MASISTTSLWVFLVICFSFTVAQTANETEICTDIGLNVGTLSAVELCIKCVETIYSPPEKHCIYGLESITTANPCSVSSESSQFEQFEAHTKEECVNTPSVTPNTTTTTTAPEPPTNTTTTTVAPITNATTTTVAPTNITTTSTPITTTIAPNVTTSTAAPSNVTTATPTLKPTTVPPQPSTGGGGINWGSFFGGIAFTAGVSSVAYVVWRFYKARTERNYHTFPATSRFASFC